MSLSLGVPCIHHKQCESGYCSGSLCATPGKYTPCNPKSSVYPCPDSYSCHPLTNYCTMFKLSIKSNCKYSSECVWGNYCANGRCRKRKDVGSKCSGRSECTWDGLCVDGRCKRKCLVDADCLVEDDRRDKWHCNGQDGEYRFCLKTKSKPVISEEGGYTKVLNDSFPQREGSHIYVGVTIFWISWAIIGVAIGAIMLGIVRVLVRRRKKEEEEKEKEKERERERIRAEMPNNPYMNSQQMEQFAIPPPSYAEAIHTLPSSNPDNNVVDDNSPKN